MSESEEIEVLNVNSEKFNKLELNKIYHIIIYLIVNIIKKLNCICHIYIDTTRP